MNPTLAGLRLRRRLTASAASTATAACLLAAGWLGCGPARAQAAAPTFDVFEYVVAGNSVLSAAAIEAAVLPFLGERKSLKDVEAARAALEKAYQDAGYLSVLVTIPEQAVDGGEVALQVVEAVVDRLKVAGAAYTLPSVIKAQVPELAEGQVPNFNRLQDQLKALNRGGDARVTPVLRAGRFPGTVEVQLDVDDQLPLHGSVELNNRQSANTTASRLAASLRYDNLWQLRHSIGISLQVAPERPSDAQVASLTYVLPSGRANDVVSIYAVQSRSDFASLSSAPGLGLLGNSDTVGLRYTLPMSSGAEGGQTFAVGLDRKNIRQTLKIQDGSTSNSPISYVPLVASFNASVLGDSRSSAVDLGLSIGLRGLFGNDDAKFAARRSGASARYIGLRAGVDHTENLGRWALRGKLDGQLASGPLVASEQLVAGGAETVRGYLEGERAGDNGVRASIELRTPAFSPAGAASAWRVGGLVFIDVASLSTQQPVAPQVARHALRSTGLGLRVTAPRGLTLEADAARALVDGDSTRAMSTRLHARAIWGY